MVPANGTLHSSEIGICAVSRAVRNNSGASVDHRVCQRDGSLVNRILDPVFSVSYASLGDSAGGE
jgi:hypothetical protein